jgi:type II secretory pathway component PulK
MPVMRSHRRQQGVILPLVLIIGLLISASIFAFVRRSAVDGMIVRNRVDAQAADALARGGVRIGLGIVWQSRFDEQLAALDAGLDAGLGAPPETSDIWAEVRSRTLRAGPNATVKITIEDIGARLNLNSLVPLGKEGIEGQASEEAQELLVHFIEKVLTELELVGEDRLYDAREMARNLLDYIDADETAIGGRNENDYYLAQAPPYLAANRPLLSAEEIALVEGFDVQIAEAMKPYVTVHPLTGGTGINLNTAPAHVLALLYHGSSGDMRLASADIVRNIMQARLDDRLVCTQAETDPDRCIPLSEVGLGEGAIFPPVVLPSESTVFIVRAEAKVSQARRSIEAVVDVTNPGEPLLLSWRPL